MEKATLYGLATGGLVGILNELSRGEIGNILKISVAMITFLCILFYVKKR